MNLTPSHPVDGNADFHEEQPLDGDEDFGYVVTRDRLSGPDGQPLKLAEWSAQDFSSIYTRFRPHLERHARRFLNNPSQVDEVVQDAFLYLMVTLPELDSEIGVLRFLKWKTRLLCLDVIRVSGRAYVSNIDDIAEPASQDMEAVAYLEQQDDAAVLRLALSKLSPRHREVLLASIYEEKSTVQIAAQVGLSENATRQLIFRARSAFKKALLGDGVDTQGMSAAAILSVAARKAGQEAKKFGAQAMVVALFLTLAVGAVANFAGRGGQTQQVAALQKPTERPAKLIPPTMETVQIDEKPITGKSGAKKFSPQNSPSPSSSPTVEASDELVSFAYSAAAAGMLPEASNLVAQYLAADKRQILNIAGDPLSGQFEYSLETSNVTSLLVSFTFDGETYRSYPYGYTTAKIGSNTLVVRGTLGYFIDSKSRVVTGNPLQSAQFELRLQLDGSGKAYSADLKLIN